MPANILATLNQLSQIGVEVTPGTAVAATKRLTSMGIPMTPAQNIQRFSPRGAKFSTAHALNQEWSEGEIGDDSGMAYNEIQYVLSSLLSKPANPTALAALAWSAGSKVIGQAVVETSAVGPPIVNSTFRVIATDGSDATEPTWTTAPNVGNTIVHEGVTWRNEGVAPTTSAYEWTFDIATYQRDVVQTYTIETGDALTGRSYRSAFCYFTGIEIESARADAVSLGGSLVGNAREENFTLTNLAGSEPQLIPATPAHLNIYMNNSAASIGTTQLDGNFTTAISMSDRATQAWFHGRQYKGPAGRVETAPEATFELTQADGTEVDEMLLALRNSQRKFFRFEWVGPEIVPGRYNMIQWDVAGNIGDSIEYDDEEGVVAVTVPFEAEHDGTWGRAMRVRVINNANAL